MRGPEQPSFVIGYCRRVKDQKTVRGLPAKRDDNKIDDSKVPFKESISSAVHLETQGHR
jgi:hypothetical protein